MVLPVCTDAVRPSVVGPKYIVVPIAALENRAARRYALLREKSRAAMTGA
ncbi:hypothetical protein GCM10027278_26670 [Paralcaligenes ginsengisoli]